MDTCPPPHHVTRRNGVVKVSIVTIDPATVETIVQTHSCNVKIKVLKDIPAHLMCIGNVFMKWHYKRLVYRHVESLLKRVHGPQKPVNAQSSIVTGKDGN